MIAAVVLDPDFGPDEYLAAGRLGGWFLDYETRRTLTARGSGVGAGGRGRGGGRRGSGGRGRGSAEIRQLRAQVREANARARAAERRAVAAARDAVYYKAAYRRGAAWLRAANAAQRARLREFRESERARKREVRLLAHFLTPAKQRTPYQRRVVSRARRQFELGERATLAPATERTTLQATFDRYARKLDEIYGEHFEGMHAGDTFRNLNNTQKIEAIERSAELHQQWVDVGQPTDAKVLGRRNFTVFYHSAFPGAAQ
jgi:hypothetical protein